MLFCKKIKRSCEYCQHGTAMRDEQILCAKRGVVSVLDSCRKFRYDPTKRVPLKPEAPDFEQYQQSDFVL